MSEQRAVWIRIVVVVAVLGLSASISPPGMAQGNRVDPPVIPVTLNTLQQPTGNIAAQVSFSFEQGQNFLDEPVAEPTWVYTRDISYPGETELIACGFENSPSASITDPNGETQSAALEETFWGLSSGCWKYAMSWTTGVLLGEYMLQINGDNGSVARTWELAYPDYPTTLYTIPNQEIVLMGFAPGQEVSVDFYGYDASLAGAFIDGKFWDSELVKVDEYGAAILQLNLGLAAPFPDVKYLVEGYPYAHYSWRRYDDWRAINNYTSPDTMIRQYYDAINQQWYDLAWENLSTHYKDKYNPGEDGGHDFETYKNWWDSVARVDVQDVVVSDQSDGFATVTTTYGFTMQNGNQTQGTTIFTLIFSPTEQRWLFYDQN